MRSKQLYLQEDVWKALHIQSRQRGTSISELVVKQYAISMGVRPLAGGRRCRRWSAFGGTEKGLSASDTRLCMRSSRQSVASRSTPRSVSGQATAAAVCGERPRRTRGALIAATVSADRLELWMRNRIFDVTAAGVAKTDATGAGYGTTSASVGIEIAFDTGVPVRDPTPAISSL